MSFFVVPLVVSIAFLLRLGLIMTGLLKGPILRSFEKYGDSENIYYPLPALLLWGGVFMLSLSRIIAITAGIWLPTTIPGLALLVGAYFAQSHPELPRQFPRLFMSFPRWYFDLRDRTSRYERRRLAYMWLWLPPRLRFIYNGNDRAFNQWADLVIMATMRYEEGQEVWSEKPLNANIRSS